MPYRDDWDWLRSLLTTPFTLRTLFEPHNEHLIPLPRLLFALQYRLEGMGGVFLFCVAMATYAVMGWAFWRQIRLRWPRDRQMRRFAFGLVAACLFFTYQLQSVVFVAAILFPLVEMFAVVAIAAAVAATSDRDDRAGRRQLQWWMLAAAATIGAALTTTNGLVVPAILAFLSWTDARRNRAWIAWFTLQAIFIYGYAVLVLARSNQPALAADRWSLESLTSMLAFFLTFFSSGIVYGGSVVGAVIGGVFVAAGCYAVWTVARDAGRSPQIERFAAALLMFSAATAAMAALGRSEFGVTQAAQSRYATFTLVYWAALIVWGLSRSERLAQWRGRRRLFTMSAAVACTALGLVVQVIVGVIWIAKTDNLSFASLALAAGVDDDEWIATLHPEMHHVYETRTLLVADGRWRLADERIGAVIPGPTAPVCRGSVRLMEVRPGPGWRLEGDARGTRQHGRRDRRPVADFGICPGTADGRHAEPDADGYSRSGVAAVAFRGPSRTSVGRVRPGRGWAAVPHARDGRRWQRSLLCRHRRALNSGQLQLHLEKDAAG